MTTQLVFTIALIPTFIGIVILRLTSNPRYLLLCAGLNGFSGLLVLVLAAGYRSLCLMPIGVMLFLLFVRWFRARWDNRR